MLTQQVECSLLGKEGETTAPFKILGVYVVFMPLSCRPIGVSLTGQLRDISRVRMYRFIDGDGIWMPSGEGRDRVIETLR